MSLVDPSAKLCIILLLSIISNHLPPAVAKPNAAPEPEPEPKPNDAPEPDVDPVMTDELLNSLDAAKALGDVLPQIQSNNPLPSNYGRYNLAAIASDTIYCPPIGVDILKNRNGSSVDAAIATFLCVGLVNAHSCGIGGGYVATIYEKPKNGQRKEMVSQLARERAPLAAKQDMFVDMPILSKIGGLSVGVPGQVHGLYRLWRRYGRLDWGELFKEPIRMCEEGFPVERDLARVIRIFNVSIKADPNLAEIFLKPDGTILREGDLLINRRLGRTLREIAKNPASFYHGKLAKDIVKDIQDYGGIITDEDMGKYMSEFQPPTSKYLKNGGYTLYNPPPPASGVVMNYIMGILDGYNISCKDISDDQRAILTYHRIAESFKFAYAKRSELGDAKFVDVKELVSQMLSDDYVASIRKKKTTATLR